MLQDCNNFSSPTGENMLTILVIEDNIDMLEMLSEVLILMEYRVYTAQNGNHAVQILDQATLPPDVILSDWRMPKMDGRTLMVTLSKNPGWSNIPVIIMSGCDHDMTDAIKSGAFAYLSKPFDMDYLSDLLYQLVDKRASASTVL